MGSLGQSEEIPSDNDRPIQESVVKEAAADFPNHGAFSFKSRLLSAGLREALEHLMNPRKKRAFQLCHTVGPAFQIADESVQKKMFLGAFPLWAPFSTSKSLLEHLGDFFNLKEAC
ncbi:hypothetical protein TRVL_01087 [Trypanosoma vivax]|nr:hypothetical protein TRVL_01087 [Trypanosoma vivax]